MKWQYRLFIKISVSETKEEPCMRQMTCWKERRVFEVMLQSAEHSHFNSGGCKERGASLQAEGTPKQAVFKKRYCHLLAIELEKQIVHL